MINTSELTDRLIDGGTDITLAFKHPDDRTIIAISALVSKILSRLDRVFFIDSLIIIVKEIVLNAYKANAKRWYFSSRGLDIADPEQYAAGMARFDHEVVRNLERIRDDMERSDYTITLVISKRPEGIILSITNNVPILPDELERVRARLRKAGDFDNLRDVYTSLYDTTEGAGMGIILSSLLLRHYGIDASSLTVTPGENSVTTSLTVPYEFRPREVVSIIRDRIVAAIEGLPTFPKNIVELQGMCADPSVAIEAIAERITHDPCLSAEILKVANSAGFVTRKRIETVHEALMIIGIKNLQTILVVTAARKILAQRYHKFEELWEHCTKTAFYARRIAHALKLGAAADHAFLAGLLHDIGKIVLLSTDLTLVNQIADLVANRKVRASTIIEEATVGISHGAIGELIARKWNFPAFLIEAIRDHHTPLNAPPEYSVSVSVVYLANMLVNIESNDCAYSYVETQVLERFGIAGEDAFNALHDQIRTEYAEHSAAMNA
ncbi:MAG TPA: HDOD domain-containing protein [Spirochaetota bacterium]|nr:HDOD domain-containing protein [Spirochaetota bacterium]HPI23554.1 HDOD domain-containing protein [Spirochaetota bacterium]HPU86740.1 HDOD domain-containing protein [Spirochaetota bacterium]